LLFWLAVEAIANFLDCNHVAIEGFGHQYVGELVQALTTLDGFNNSLTPFRASCCIVVAFLSSDRHSIRFLNA
jgi:hypothetical protein